MNKFPAWWCDDITIFNKYVDNQTNVVKWYKTQVSNCFWKNMFEQRIVKDTTVATNSILCRVPKDARYLDIASWTMTPNDEKANYFTLNVGDIIIKGIVDDYIDEYMSGHRSTDIIKKYKQTSECFVVESASNNATFGRSQQHYLARGV